VLLSNSTSTEFYRVNHIIDGLTVYNNQLYWTDTQNGLIASLSINSSPLRHRVLVTGLDKPRAIVTYTEYELILLIMFASVLVYNAYRLDAICCALFNTKSYTSV